MKIGFVLDDTLDTADGVQQHVLLLGSWLSGHGHEVHYLTTKSHRDDVAHLHSLGKHLRIKFNRNVVPFVLPSSPKKIASLLLQEQFDVLHVQMPYNPAFGARVVSLAPSHTAVVGTFHIAPYSFTEKVLSQVLGYWLKPTIKRFDAAISVSRPAQDLAESAFGLTSSIVPNMVDTKSYRLKDKLNHHQPPRIVFVGRLVERKGCQHFIKSLGLLDTPFKATIVGDGNQRQTLKNLARSMKIDDRVRFAGFVTETQKRKILSEADIAVFPSTGGESFGIVLIEAMAAGSCIVMAGDNPGYASVLGSLPESLIEPNDHKMFADRLSRFINDRARAQKLYAAQQKLVRQFDVEVVAKEVLKTYERAIANRNRKSHTKG